MSAFALCTVALIGGCSSQDDGDAETVATSASESATPSASESATPSASESATPSASESATDAEAGDANVIAIDITNGQVQPTNVRLDAKVGEPIILRVTSDAVDELHIHAVPEHTFAVAESEDVQEFEFVVNVPGQVAIELHDAGVTVATLRVQA